MPISRTVYFLIFLLVPLFAFAQENALAPEANASSLRSDSLQRLLYGSEGQERVQHLNALSWELRFVNPSRAYRLAQEAHNLAKGLGLTEATAVATKHMGIARTFQGRYAEGLSLIFEEIEMRKQLGDTAGMAVANNNIGYILMEQENYDLALEYYYRSLRITDSMVILPSLRAITLNNVGQIHLDKGQLDLALNAHLESLEVLKQVPESDFAMAANLENLGEISLKRKAYDEALAYFRKALNLEQLLGNTVWEAKAYNRLAATHLAQGQLDSALWCVNKGLTLATPLENKQTERDLAQTAADVYATLGNMERAYEYRTRYGRLNDSLLRAASAERIASLENRFLLAQKQNEQDLEKERVARTSLELQDARLTRNAALIVAGCVLLLALLLFTINRMRHRTNRVLLEQKNEVRKQRDALEGANHHLTKVNHEMDNFMYRVSHDLRSPLTSLMGLIKLASEEIEPKKRDEYLGLMNKSVNKLDAFIQDIINLTRNNRQSLRYSVVEIRPMVEDYFEQYMFHDGRKDIDCELEMKGMTSMVTDQYRLGVILSNLISNAVIYAKVYREDAVVKISSQIDEERAILQVRDNGPGIIADHKDKVFDMFFRSSNTTDGSGLGLYIVRETVEKLGGTVRVVSEARHGATFIVELPNQKLGTEHHPPTTDLDQVLNA